MCKIDDTLTSRIQQDLAPHIRTAMALYLVSPLNPWANRFKICFAANYPE